MLNKVDVIRKASGSIRKNADKIELECDAVQTGVDRLLSQAWTLSPASRSRWQMPGSV